MADEYELKKSRREISRSIPDEVLFEEILVRLPVKPLIAYKSVCKMWLYTIESRSFIEAHRRRHCCEYSDQIVFTPFKSVYDPVTKSSSLLPSTKSFRSDLIKMTSRPLDVMLPPEMTRINKTRVGLRYWKAMIRVLGPIRTTSIYCVVSYLKRNGVFDFYQDLTSAKIAICNPSTRDCKLASPFPPKEMPRLLELAATYCCCAKYGFGVTADGDYKLVVVLTCSDPKNLLSYVYSVRQGAWKKIVDSENGMVSGLDLHDKQGFPEIYDNNLELCPQVFLNGCWHWIAKFEDETWNVLTFNVVKKKVGDLLTNLPISIIHEIISLIPVREAVRTCVLSSQWRYTWVTLPNLVFEDKHFSDYRATKKFITNVLLYHKGPIYKFQISVPFSPSSETMDQWIQCLSMNDIRELTINMNYDYYVRLPSSIYSCKKLTYLRLYNCVLVTPPSSFNGFLFLRDLLLHRVHLYPWSSDKIESLFAKSARLEKLSVVNSGSFKLCIYAPSLKYLSVDGTYEDMSLHAPLLVVMEITMFLASDFKVGGGEDYECNFTHFLGRCTDLEKLSLEWKTVEYLSWDIVSSHRSLVFPRLKDIKLEVNFYLIRHALVASRIVVGAPNLEKLTINCEICKETVHPNLTAEKVSVMDFQSALHSTFEKLRIVRMVFVTGSHLEMEFIKYLLENSPVLEVMFILLRCESCDGEKKQILRELLLNCTCASPIANIIVT